MIRVELAYSKHLKTFILLFGKTNEINRGLLSINKEQAKDLIKMFNLKRSRFIGKSYGLIYFV